MVEVVNFTKIRTDKKFLEKILKIVLKEEGLKKAQVSVVLVGEKKIKELNKRHRNKNKPTDVLSFPAQTLKAKAEKNFVFPSSDLLQLGEIMLCPRQIKKKFESRESLTSQKALAKVFLHGLLHLLGYEHQKVGQRKIMEAKENEYFSKIF